MEGENSFKRNESHTSLGLSNRTFDIVALAASAGGLRALSQVLAALPADFRAAIVVVQHLDPRHRPLMADILRRRTPLRVSTSGKSYKPLTRNSSPAMRSLKL